MEQKKETPEEMDKRIRAELKAEAPPPVGNSEPAFSTAKGKSSGGDGFSVFNMKFLAAVFIIGLIVSYLVVTFVGVSPLTANINTVKKTADTAQASASAAVDAANKAQTTANNATNTAQTNLQTAINTLQGKIDGINASMTTLQGKNYVTPDQISKFATTDQLSKVATNEQIANLQTQLDALKKQLANDETAIAAIQSSQKTDEAAITKLQTTPPTTTTTTTSSGSNSGSSALTGVNVNVLGNPFTGSSVLAINGLTASGNMQSASFSFTVNNTTSNTISNLQLAIGLQTVNASNTGYVTLPTDATYALVSSGLSTIWTYQGYQSNILEFTNTSLGGIFGGVGGINLPVGSTTFTVTFTITAGATTTSSTSIPSFNAYPLVKVVGSS